MPISEEQRIERQSFIGSSDIACLFGADPYKTSLDLYNSKVGLAEEKESTAISLGNHLEEGIIAYVAEKLKAEVDTELQQRHVKGLLAANLDAVFLSHFFRKQIDEACNVEVKTTGFSGKSPEADQWGKAGTAQIPNRVMLQVQHQMECSNLNFSLVPLLSGHDGSGCRVYRVPRNLRTGKAIAKVAETFWRRHVEPHCPPDPTTIFASTL